MDLVWGNEKASKFVTNVGLITTEGPNGANIMAAEWTYYVSWSPALIAVHLGGGKTAKATSENIMATREFGVNIAASGQNVISSIAGGSSGRDVDKMAVLKEMGVQFYPAKGIKPALLRGAAINIECKLMEAKELGDHTMFIGEVVSIEADLAKEPLLYSFGKYYARGEQLHKPEQAVLAQIEQLKARFSKRKA
ncbi:MAG: flavin reductase family protein [Candidatus Micrarchaeia archaeon]